LSGVMASPICRCGGSIDGAAVGPNAWQKTMSRAPGLSSKQHACGYFREGSSANFVAGAAARDPIDTFASGCCAQMVLCGPSHASKRKNGNAMGNGEPPRAWSGGGCQALAPVITVFSQARYWSTPKTMRVRLGSSSAAGGLPCIAPSPGPGPRNQGRGNGTPIAGAALGGKRSGALEQRTAAPAGR
jgi:hypothetical protein